MKLGTVTKEVTMLKRAPELEDARVLTVMLEGNSLAALDLAGARVGDRVLVALGGGTWRYCMNAPADAVIAAVVKE